MQQRAVVDLAAELPKLVVAAAADLCLDPGTEPGAVQVDIRRFHTFAVNNPDVWLEMRLTEVVRNEKRRHNARDTLSDVLTDWFDTRELDPSYAIDLFFGPGHGCLSFKLEKGLRTEERW